MTKTYSHVVWRGVALPNLPWLHVTDSDFIWHSWSACSLTSAGLCFLESVCFLVKLFWPFSGFNMPTASYHCCSGEKRRNNQSRGRGGSADPYKHEITRYCYKSHKQFHMKFLPLNLFHSLTLTPLIFYHILCFYSSISCSFPHPFPPSSLTLSLSSHLLWISLSLLQVALLLLLLPSSSRYHFIGLLVPLEIPNDKQSKPSEPLPCCPHRAAESKQTGYELKHSHSPPQPPTINPHIGFRHLNTHTSSATTKQKCLTSEFTV